MLLPSPSPALSVTNVSKWYDPAHAHPAVNNLDLELHQGEIMALLGPSGCGKTTLLRMIAGFESLNAGTIALAGKTVANTNTTLSPEARRVGFVFQDYALFPHLTVLQNVLFGLHGKLREGYTGRKAKRKRAEAVLDLVGLTVFRNRRPHQLSGGQQQRVALARALAPEPTIMLLDEPFSNLDAALRGNTRAEIKHILKATQTTALLVTHDQEEALTFADTLAVMRAGKLEQIGKPEHVYSQPASAFVASFLGTTNLLDGVVRGNKVETVLGLLEFPPPTATHHLTSKSVKISLRPESLRLLPCPHHHTQHQNTTHQGIEVTIQRRDFKGHNITYHCHDAQGQDYIVHVSAETTPQYQQGERGILQAQGNAVVLRS